MKKRQIDIQIKQGVELNKSKSWFKNLANRVLNFEDVANPIEISLVITDKRTIRYLNKSYRQQDSYTDVLAIKRGNRGSMVCFGDEMLDMPAYLNENVVDAIGAGDSFNAGFIFKYIMGSPIRECQSFGNLTGAMSTTAAGGTKAFQDDEEFRKKAMDLFGYAI